jgi:hypothetical protein
MINSRRMRRGRNLERVSSKRNVCGILVGKPEVNRLLGRPRCRWRHNVKMDLREAGEPESIGTTA